MLDEEYNDSKFFLSIAINKENTMRKYEICAYVIVILFVTYSCKKDASNRITSIVEEWNNKEIIYPHQMSLLY